MTTQKAAWGGFIFLDRDSDLFNEDGTRDVLEPELVAFLQAGFDSGSGVADPGNRFTADPGLRAFMNELMAEIDVASMEDLDGASLESLLEGIFDS